MRLRQSQEINTQAGDTLSNPLENLFHRSSSHVAIWQLLIGTTPTPTLPILLSEQQTNKKALCPNITEATYMFREVYREEPSHILLCRVHFRT